MSEPWFLPIPRPSVAPLSTTPGPTYTHCTGCPGVALIVSDFPDYYNRKADKKQLRRGSFALTSRKNAVHHGASTAV